MSTEIALTISALGENAEAALKDIQTPRRFFTVEDSNEDGVALIVIRHLLPMDWRPTLDEIAAKHGVILEIISVLTDPEDWEIDEGLDAQDFWRVGPDEKVLATYEAMLHAIGAINVVTRRFDKETR